MQNFLRSLCFLRVQLGHESAENFQNFFLNLTALALTMSINVLQLRASTGFGGAENIILSSCQNLDSRRFRASILTTFPARFESNFLADAAQRLGIPCHTLRYDHRFSPAGVRYFLRYLDEHKIDIVHAHGYRENILAGLGAYYKNIATVSTAHGWITDPVRTQIDLWALKALHRIVAVSPSVEEKLLRAGFKKDRIVLLLNAVDVRQFHRQAPCPSLQEQFGIAPGTFVIGTAARLSPEKGLADLIRAAQQVVKQCPQVKFLIVGDGPERAVLEKLAVELGLQDFVSFAGYQENVAAFYNLMNLYASPSLQEAMPKSLLEAAACELPIVATAVGGVPQIIQPGETGVLLPAGDPQRLAAEIIRLIQNPGLGEQYGRKARELICAKFSETEAIKKLENIYAEVFAEVRRPNRRSH